MAKRAGSSNRGPGPELHQANPTDADRSAERPRRTAGPADGPAPQAATLGARLAWARRRRGLTQKALSERLGKSRATINLYESDKVNPPVEQVARMASLLEVAPEFLAFGSSLASVSADEIDQPGTEIVSLPEISLTEGSQATGVYALPRAMAETFGITAEAGPQVHVLDRPAPEFNLGAGDRVIVTRANALDISHAIYVLRSGAGVELVRRLPSLSPTASTINVIGSYGDAQEIEPGAVELIGRVVAAIQKC